MHLPFKNKNFIVSTSTHLVLANYEEISELPLSPHPGSFGIKRKNHCHEGIDLYCQPKESVYAMECGIIVNIVEFTGEKVGSPWWNSTWAILIEGKSGVINYGEITVEANFKIGMHIKESQKLGVVAQVLKKDKGRPMNMLHLELYKAGTLNPCSIWNLDSPQPENLLDPTCLIQDCLQKKIKKTFK